MDSAIKNKLFGKTVKKPILNLLKPPSEAFFITNN
jgi:hypothetical protein